jgi:uncharacterized protein YlxW (UPF0749 family)
MTTEHSTTRSFSTQLLVDLVLDPRDPGYEAAARRRGGLSSRRWYDKPAVAIGCLMAGFLLAVAYVHTHRGAPEAAKVHNDLVTRVRSAEDRANGLATDAQALATRLNTLRNAALAGGSGTLAAQLNLSQLLAGEVAVTGPGLRVVLSEPPAAQPTTGPGRGGTVPITVGHILTDRDVRSVVNELWADGAEAISVNNIRLTPTSAIRFAGEAVLVDFEPITSPYTIRAIGRADSLDTGFAASDVASRYQTLAGADGIGFSFQEQSTLSLPASAVITPRYARVPAGASK